MRTLVMVVCLVLAAAAEAHANVSLKNGNFFIGYTDISYPGGFEPKIERVYNSRSSFKSMFGWCWSSDFEVYLEVNGDGSITVLENGGGAHNVFEPAGGVDRQRREREIQTIVALSNKPLGEVDSYRAKLRDDDRFREGEWQDLVKAKKLGPQEVEVGAEFVSDRFGHQKILRTAEGYVRTKSDKKTELFDRAGRLARLTDLNGNFIDIARDRDGRIKSLTDNFHRTLAFTYTSRGFVATVTGTDGRTKRTATYRYDKTDDLVYTKDSEGNVYKYEYDWNHNLVAIRYSDKTSLEIGYYLRQRGEQAAVQKDRDGTTTVYTYWTDPQDPDVYGTTSEMIDADGKDISVSEYTYKEARTPAGATYLKQMIRVVDGERTITEYDRTCNQPLKIEWNGEVSILKYDGRCQVTYKETPTEITKLAYDPKSNKVSRVEKQSKLREDQHSWASYRYDGAANLIAAENSDGKALALEYDEHGRIAKIVGSGDKARTLLFAYNSNSKPTKITVEGVGSIKITYRPNGEIKKVDSDGGRSVSLTVTSTFQDLLDIIRPAGVSLSF